MIKVCINKDTGSGRLGGHCTEFAFTGLPDVEFAALSDSNSEPPALTALLSLWK